MTLLGPKWTAALCVEGAAEVVTVCRGSTPATRCHRDWFVPRGTVLATPAVPTRRTCPGNSCCQDSLNFLAKLGLQNLGDGRNVRHGGREAYGRRARQVQGASGTAEEDSARLDVVLRQDLGALNKAVADPAIPLVIMVLFYKR